jgi:hypothetical protein
LIVFAPCALQGLSLLRAAQYESNENRSECETNERIHTSVQPTRSIKSKATPAEDLPASLQPLTADCRLQHWVRLSRVLTPAVVEWSPLMRC